jgi:glycosyltransferase involved in cell wall biosynthesis
MPARLSIVVPAKNERAAIANVVAGIRQHAQDAEIIVVDDGSTDSTGDLAASAGADLVIRNRYSIGNGGAIKKGVRAASGEILVLMDGDGQHAPADIPRLLSLLHDGYDMVVGARAVDSHASVARALANGLYNTVASYVTGHAISDLTSGFRAVRAKRLKQFLHLMPNGFSYPTTITMAFFRAGHLVSYLPIQAHKRVGRSHISVVRDGLRFLLIIFRIGTLYSPLKIFVPASAVPFVLAIGYYAYTLTTSGRFTNMSALLLSTSALIFMIGLVSEQITQLLYRSSEED